MTASKNTNGAESAVISLDSDDEGSSANKYEDSPEFVNEEEDVDPSEEYPKILQTLDLHLGVAAQHLAVLPASMAGSTSTIPRPYEEISNKIVFAAACSDNYVRLITLPLTPPSPASRERAEFRKHPYNTVGGHGSWGEKIVKLNGHQKPADGVSLTLNLSNNSRQDVRSPELVDPAIIVSSHSKEATGLLLLFRVPLKSVAELLDPFQKVYLSSPAVRISFNTSSSTPRAGHLLVAEYNGACRLYDYNLLSRSSEDQHGRVTEQGSWLVSLYSGFHNRKHESDSSGHLPSFGRKSIIDAKWASAGRAIIALLSDGEWIVWDIEGAGPGASQGLLGRQGIQGGSKSVCALSGYIESGSKFRTGQPQQTGSKFAPMTPGTRKVTEPFANRQPNTSSRGQLSILPLPSFSTSTSSDDSVAFWYGETFAIIPSLSKYWSSHQAGGSNPFAGTNGGRLVKLDTFDLQGECCSGIVQIPKVQSSGGPLFEILVLGEHRFTIVSLASQAKKPQFRSSGKLQLGERSTNSGGLEDIDRALALMENRDSRMDLF